MHIWINGKILRENKAFIGVQEEGVRYGAGLFETMRIYQGRPFLLARHLTRMYQSAKLLGFTPTYPEEVIIFAAARLIKVNQITEGVLRVYATPESIWLTTSPRIPYEEKNYHTGLCAMMAEERRNETSLLTGLKTFNYLENILAKRKAASLHFHEAIFLNGKGKVAEGSASNIFLIKNHQLITPGLQEGILPGITRKFVLELALESSLPAEEGEVSLESLLQADECFLTNSLMEIMPLVKVGEETIGAGIPGKLTRELGQAYRAKINV